MANLINFKGTTGVELIGLILEASNYPPTEKIPLPKSGMIASLQISWDISRGVKLENFLAAVSSSEASTGNVNKIVQLLTVLPLPGQASLTYAVTPSDNNSGAETNWLDGFPGRNLPILSIGGATKPEIKVRIPFVKTGGQTETNVGFRLINTIPIGQEIEMSAQGGQQGAPPFTAIATIVYIFDEIQPLQ